MEQIDLQERIIEAKEEDYPAAHSMDTTWFAVDKDGYIACMESDEVGAVPCAYAGDQGDGSEVLEVLAKHLGKPYPEDFYSANETGDFTNSLGLYMYRSGFGFFPPPLPGETAIDPEGEFDDVVEAYQRQAAPAEPLHLSKLPVNLQEEVKHAMIYSNSFKDAEWLQPALLVPCQYWLVDVPEPKAVDVDGKLRVIPETLRMENAPPPTHKSQLPKPEIEGGGKPWWKKFFGG